MALTLEKPQFVNADAQAITREMIAAYEAASGKTLWPAQAERLLIDLFAYRETLVRSAIQSAAEQNLVAFARAPMLDYLAELVGVYRLPAQPARTTVQFSLAVAPSLTIPIPAGTRLSATDSLLFTTDSEVRLTPTASRVTVSATCSEAGIQGNGWQPAQISTLMEAIDDGDIQVTNTTPSEGGSDVEDDEHLRNRIRLAPASFSTAGSREAYRFHAMSAHPGICDVAVTRPKPGTVNLYPLLTSGLPDKTVLSLVTALCSEERVRPLNDTVQVLAPEKVDYTITAQLTCYASQPGEPVLKQAWQAAEQYVARQAKQLGRDIVPSQIIAALSVPGVYRVQLTSFTTLESTVLSAQQWAHCSDIQLTLGTESGDDR
ncbi:baseplate J/gp47 family protein [Candidatus Arsenophonus nilaparvatae]|uniref:baseplate assembly protein n=1 Tax=Candidatus Arsenophonus nilaparvatae TaxID=1247023 RepID=UPI00050952EB|nr:baseplate J/gp47 family protein [Candidatus Arsenophonus nilaparvatae]